MIKTWLKPKKHWATSTRFPMKPVVLTYGSRKYDQNCASLWCQNRPAPYVEIYVTACGQEPFCRTSPHTVLIAFSWAICQKDRLHRESRACRRLREILFRTWMKCPCRTTPSTVLIAHTWAICQNDRLHRKSQACRRLREILFSLFYMVLVVP